VKDDVPWATFEETLALINGWSNGQKKEEGKGEGRKRGERGTKIVCGDWGEMGRGRRGAHLQEHGEVVVV